MTFNSLKTAIAAVLLFVAVPELSAQDSKAQAILEKMSEKMQKYESVAANFTSKMVDKQSDMEVNQSGSVKVSGDNYKLEMGDFTVICNGEDVWTYSKKSNEVMVDLAADLYDEEGIAPADLFTIWETGFKHQYAGVETVNGVECDVIKLFPVDPANKSFHTIKIYIEPAGLEMKRAVILGKEGNDTIYDLNSFDTAFINSSVFKFDPSKFPGVETIDNR